MSINRESIEDMVKKGLVEDIFKMECAFELGKKIGERSGDLNRNVNGYFGELFATIQSALRIESILAAARVYDTPSKKYPTRCLRGVLNYLIENKDDLPKIREPYQLQIHLEHMSAPRELVNTIKNQPTEFASQFSFFVQSLLETPFRIDTLEKLKLVRDKAIAHNEQVEEIVGPTWESLQDLINIAKDVVGTLGWAYFSTGYVINGDYILSDDARRSSVALNKLLNLIYNQ
ncbi:MAG: hypothetical protein ABSD46_01780 [Bacteroidota bacterium]